MLIVASRLISPISILCISITFYFLTPLYHASLHYGSLIIWSFICCSMQQIFIEHLPCIRDLSRHWRYGNNHHGLQSQGADTLIGAQKRKRIHQSIAAIKLYTNDHTVQQLTTIHGNSYTWGSAGQLWSGRLRSGSCLSGHKSAVFGSRLRVGLRSSSCCLF